MLVCSCAPGTGARLKEAWKEKLSPASSVAKTREAPPESHLKVGEVYRAKDGSASMAVKKYRSLTGDACIKLRVERNGRAEYELLCGRDGVWRRYPAFSAEKATHDRREGK
ncbi:MAG: hypothetical protein ABW189_02520 [Rickettsiales bacterium]